MLPGDLEPPKRRDKLSAEAREWLALTPQDFLVLVALVCLGLSWMVFDDLYLIIASYVVGSATAILAVPLGAIPKPELSNFLNWSKKWSYHAVVVFVVLGFWARFAFYAVENFPR